MTTTEAAMRIVLASMGAEELGQLGVAVDEAPVEGREAAGG
jgi:hypothetical protein